jgi:hypothetical protein
VAQRCGCGTTTCSCFIQQGTGTTVTGVGSSSNPYVINASGGGGGGAVVELTIAEINALASAATLDMATTYIVTDWVSGTDSWSQLTGPNRLRVHAMDVNKISGFVEVETPLGSKGPKDGEFTWDFPGTMVRLRDGLRNDVSGGNGRMVDTFPWGDFGSVGNTIIDCSVDNPDAISVGFSNCMMTGVQIDLAGATSFSMNDCNMTSSLITVTGDADLTMGGCRGTDALITASSGTVDITATTIDWLLQIAVPTGTTVEMGGCVIGSGFELNVNSTAAATVHSINQSSFAGYGVLTLQGDVTYAFNTTDYVSNTAQTVDGNGGMVNITGSRIVNPTFARNAAAIADLTINSCDILESVITIAAGAVRALTINTCSLVRAFINYTRTAAATNADTLNFSNITGSTFTWAGATDPGLSQFAGNLTITNGSTVTMTNPTTGGPIQDTVVQGQSILTINGGNIANSFLSSGFQLTTSAFSHNQVSCVGGFAQALSANNTNTYRGFGANTLI